VIRSFSKAIFDLETSILLKTQKSLTKRVKDTHLRSGSLVLTLQNCDEDFEGARRGDSLL
jgi:hypothetical protein